MTKEQIIGALKAAAKPYEEYYIDDEVMEAINTYSNPYEFVAPILEINDVHRVFAVVEVGHHRYDSADFSFLSHRRTSED